MAVIAKCIAIYKQRWLTSLWPLCRRELVTSNCSDGYFNAARLPLAGGAHSKIGHILAHEKQNYSLI